MLDTKSIKISETTYEILKSVAKKEHKTMQAILDKLLKDYQTKRFFEEVNKAYDKMTPEEWKEENKERQMLDNTLEDGMEDEDNETW